MRQFGLIRLFQDKATVLRYPNVLRDEYQKEYSAVQFSLIVRFIAEALDCEMESFQSLYNIHEKLADAMNKVLRDQLRTKQILPLVDELKVAVDSMLLEENTAAKAAETVN